MKEQNLYDLGKLQKKFFFSGPATKRGVGGEGKFFFEAQKKFLTKCKALVARPLKIFFSRLPLAKGCAELFTSISEIDGLASKLKIMNFTNNKFS